MTLNQWKVDASIVRRLADEAAPSIEWLADLGVEVLDVYFSGDELVPRGHVTHGGAAMMVLALDRPLETDVVAAIRAADGIRDVSAVTVI